METKALIAFFDKCKANDNTYSLNERQNWRDKLQEPEPYWKEQYEEQGGVHKEFELLTDFGMGIEVEFLSKEEATTMMDRMISSTLPNTLY